MPKLIRLLVTQAAIGLAIAAVLVATLLTFNIGDLRHMVGQSDMRVLTVILLWLFSGLVFGIVQCAIAMTDNADDDDDDSDGGHPAYVPIPIPVRRDRR